MDGQTDGQADRQTDGRGDCITSLANAVGNYATVELKRDTQRSYLTVLAVRERLVRTEGRITASVEWLSSIPLSTAVAISHVRIASD